jgi:hypothetical protein
LPSSSWLDIFKTVVDEGKKWSCLRYLIDHRAATFQFRFADLWILPRNKGRFEVPADARVALLFPHAQSTRKAFIQAFMSNRGFAVKVFDERESAVAWLMEPVSKPNLFAAP